MKRQHIGSRLFRVMAATLVACLFARCTAPPPLDIDEGFQVEQKSPEDFDTPPPPISTAARVTFRVLRVELPLDHPTQPLWDLLAESVLLDLSRAVWNGNGLRLGVLNPSERNDFLTMLRDNLGQSDSLFTAFDRPTALRISPPLEAIFIADLTRPGSPARLVDMDGGRLQLLAAVSPTTAGATRFSLTPHHYRHEFSLTPRDVLTKELDGRVFNELGVDVTLDPEQVLVLGLYRPAPPAPGSTSGAEETDEGVEGDLPTTPTPAATQPLPLDFGRGLFTTGRVPRDTQYLLLLRVDHTSR